MSNRTTLAEILDCEEDDIIKATIEMKALLTSQPVAVTVVFQPLNGQLLNVGITPQPTPILSTQIVPSVLRQVAAMLEAQNNGDATGISSNSP